MMPVSTTLLSVGHFYYGDFIHFDIINKLMRFIAFLLKCCYVMIIPVFIKLLGAKQGLNEFVVDFV